MNLELPTLNRQTPAKEREGTKELYAAALNDLRSARRRLLRADELNGGEVASHILHNVMFFTETALGVAETAREPQMDTNRHEYVARVD